MAQTISMLTGEKRPVAVAISYKGHETGFEIKNPAYVIKNGQTVIEEGIPTVNYNKMGCMFEAEMAGVYTIEFEHDIDTGHFKHRFIVRVRD